MNFKFLSLYFLFLFMTTFSNNFVVQYKDHYFSQTRFYDSKTGRFIGADTLVPNPTDSKAFNRYSYAYNNPLKYIDPDGHSPKQDPDNQWKSTNAFTLVHQEAHNTAINNTIAESVIPSLNRMAKGTQGESAGQFKFGTTLHSLWIPGRPKLRNIMMKANPNADPNTPQAQLFQMLEGAFNSEEQTIIDPGSWNSQIRSKFVNTDSDTFFSFLRTGLGNHRIPQDGVNYIFAPMILSFNETELIPNGPNASLIESDTDTLLGHELGHLIDRTRFYGIFPKAYATVQQMTGLAFYDLHKHGVEVLKQMAHKNPEKIKRFNLPDLDFHPTTYAEDIHGTNGRFHQSLDFENNIIRKALGYRPKTYYFDGSTALVQGAKAAVNAAIQVHR